MGRRPGKTGAHDQRRQQQQRLGHAEDPVLRRAKEPAHGHSKGIVQDGCNHKRAHQRGAVLGSVTQRGTLSSG